MKKFETYAKNERGKFIFVGWGQMLNEEFCIETKKTKRFIYKTYRWLTGKVEVYRYSRDYVEL